MTMARPAPTSAPGTLLSGKTERAEELEESGENWSQRGPQPKRTWRETQTGARPEAGAAVSYLDRLYNYVGPSASPSPLFSGAGMKYYSAPGPEAQGPASDTGLHSLGSLPNSPLVFLPSSPQISPFVHSSHSPAEQQVPCYLESTSTPAFRQNTGSKTQTTRDQFSGVSAGQTTVGSSETTKETRFAQFVATTRLDTTTVYGPARAAKRSSKRSFQGHNDYVCPATNQCTIDRNRRKSCQACRLRKCYKVGMMRGGLCKDRGGRQLVRESAWSHGTKRGGATPTRSAHLCKPPFQLSSSARGLAMPVDQVLPLLLSAEPPNICSKQKYSRPYSEVTMMTLLTSLADKELVHMIAWAKKVPGFQELSLHDQVQLLESSWLEVLIIGLVWRSIHCPGKLLFAQDLTLERNEGSCVEGMAEIFDMILAMVARFRALQLKSEEFVCLKAIILLNSGSFPFCASSVEPLNDSPTVHCMLDKITDTLMYYISKSGLGFQQQSRRQAQLLLLLSHIRHMSNKGMEHLYTMKCKNMVPLYDLLLELLDAH